MDLDFDLFFYWWGEFLKCSTVVYIYIFVFINKIHTNTEIRDRNISSPKVVTFLWNILVKYSTVHTQQLTFYKIATLICNGLNNFQLFRWKLWEGSSGGVIFKNIGVHCKIRIYFDFWMDENLSIIEKYMYIHTNKSLLFKSIQMSAQYSNQLSTLP